MAVSPPLSVEPPRVRAIRIGLRSRLVIWLMRLLLRPWLARLLSGPTERLIRTQRVVASRPVAAASGLPVEYRVLGVRRAVPGHVIGRFDDPARGVLLWLHGGAFVLPASPPAHLRFVAALCAPLGLDGFVPDYRLAPLHRFPAALDDCETAYRMLLERGVPAPRIVIGGDSAGGNLLFGVLQRIRAAGLPMPACAIGVSPATELAHTHAPPSRVRLRRRDALLAVDSLYRVIESYVGGADAADPLVSPLYADCRGFPPLYLIASDAEVLLDDSVLMARRAQQAGVPTTLDLWPGLPHAFPLFAPLLAEARAARGDMMAFLKKHLR